MGITVQGIVEVRIRRDGVIVDQEVSTNTVTDIGIDMILNTFFNGVSAPLDWYVGLRGLGDQSPSDTLEEKGWPEIVSYSEAVRPKWVTANVENGIIASAYPLIYSMVGGESVIRGIFLAASPVKAEEGSTLFMVNRLSRARILYAKDEFEVTYKLVLRRP